MKDFSLMRDAIPLNATSHESLVVCLYAFVQYSSSLPRHGGKTKNVLKYRQEDAALYHWKVEKLPRFPMMLEKLFDFVKEIFVVTSSTITLFSMAYVNEQDVAK